MVNYFNVLSHDDDEEQEKDVVVPVTPPSEILMAEKQQVMSNISIATSTGTKEKTFTPSIEIQFDFNEHNQETTFADSWVMWYTSKKEKATQPDENSEYLQNIQKLGSFNNLKEFKNLWDGIQTPLDVNGNISIFKEGIEPAWEDAKNKDGGKYSVNYIREGHGDFSRVLNAWFTLITSIVYSSWEHYHQTNGVVLTVRNWGASINLWNDNSDNLEQVQSLKDSFQNILRVKFCKFSSHKQSISKSSSETSGKDQMPLNGMKKKKIFNTNLNQLNMMNFKNFSASNDNNGHGYFGTNNNIGMKKNDVKKESMLSVRPTLPVQLSSTLTNGNSNNNNHSIVSPVVEQPTSPVNVPEIPSGVNAWSTGLLLGNPKSEEEEKPTIEEPKPVIEEPKPIVEESKPIQNQTNNNNIKSVPVGVNAWSTGILVPKPPVIVDEPKVEEIKPIKPTEQSISPKSSSTSVPASNAWSSNKLPKEQTNPPKAPKEKKERKINTSKEETEEVHKKESLWEEPEDVVVAAVPKKEKKEKYEKPVEEKPKKVEKPNKFKSNQPTSLWSNPTSIAQLIETISSQPESTPVTTSTTTTTSTTASVSTTVEPENNNVLKLEIKEAKKVPDTIEVVKKVETEWTKVEDKKPKKPKSEQSSTISSKPTPNFEPKDNLLIRNLLVEEPIEYPSPMKPVLKKEATTSSTVSQVNKKPKDNKPDHKKAVSKDTKKPVASKPVQKSSTPVQSNSLISPINIAAIVFILLIIIYLVFLR